MEKNKLGNAALVLSILALIGRFVPVLCLSSVDSVEGFIGVLVSIVLGAILGWGCGIISVILGIVGVFKKDKKKVTAIVGIVLSLIALFLPFAFV